MKMESTANENVYRLKWNDFHTSMTASFCDFRNESDFLDAVIICEGQQFRVHRLVLSACSGVFRQLFRMSKATDPVVILWDVEPVDLNLLINFMYDGHANVAEDRLPTFLALAERLKVRGLTNSAKYTGGSHLPIANRSSNISPRKSSLPSPTSSHNLKSLPMGSSGSKMTSVEQHMVDIYDVDLLTIKQEFEADENSVFPIATPEPDPTFVAGNSTAHSGFPPLYGGSNQDYEFEGSDGPNSFKDGFEDEAEEINEGSEEYSKCIENKTCPYCSKCFLRTWNVLRHIENVHQENVTPCPSCKKDFSSKSKMLRHQKGCNPKKIRRKVDGLL